MEIKVEETRTWATGKISAKELFAMLMPDYEMSQITFVTRTREPLVDDPDADIYFRGFKRREQE